MGLPKRKPNRLPGYDYGSPGAYFVTVCTRGRRGILSRISVGEGLASPDLRLTECGRIVERNIFEIEKRFNFTVDKYIIMPNHVHLLISVPEWAGGPRPSPTITDAICAFKSLSAVECGREIGVKNLWQRSFHDHVIRGEDDRQKIWEYIDSNAQKWPEDCFYVPTDGERTQ